MMLQPLRSLKRSIRRRMLGSDPIILMYHRVAEIPVDPWGLAVHPARFEEQIDALTQARRVVHLHELVKAEQSRSSKDKPLAVVTFDDGYYDVYCNARRILQRYDCPMTLFVTTGAIESGREFWWDAVCRIFLETECLPPNLSFEVGGRIIHLSVPAFDQKRGREDIYYQIWAELRERPHDEQISRLGELGRWAGCSLVARESHRAMTRKEVRDISDGLVVIGAHTINHPSLPAHRFEDQYREIAESRRVCEEFVEGSVDAFAYPFGDYDDATVSAVRKAGFSWACTVNAAVVRPATDPIRLPRIFVGDWHGDEFQRRLAEDPFQ